MKILKIYKILGNFHYDFCNTPQEFNIPYYLLFMMKTKA